MSTSKSAHEIVRESLPGVVIMPPLPSPAEDAAAEALPAGHSVAEMRQKYLGDSTAHDDAPAAPVERTASPSLKAMRRRFLGPAGPSSAAPQESARPTTESDDIEVIRVQSRSEPEDATDGPGVRSVIVSKSKGRIIGKQG